jgi:hypothetical protein
MEIEVDVKVDKQANPKNYQMSYQPWRHQLFASAIYFQVQSQQFRFRANESTKRYLTHPEYLSNIVKPTGVMWHGPASLEVDAFASNVSMEKIVTVSSLAFEMVFNVSVVDLVLLVRSSSKCIKSSLTTTDSFSFRSDITSPFSDNTNPKRDKEAKIWI